MYSVVSSFNCTHCSHLFWPNTIKFLDNTLATQHLTPKIIPKITPKSYHKKLHPKNTPKITLQNDPSRRAPLIHAYKAQGRVDINIIRYMKRDKTEYFSSKLVRFSKQISNANISAPVRDNSSKCSVGQSLSFEDDIQASSSRGIKTNSRRNNFIIQDLSLSFRDSLDIL